MSYSKWTETYQKLVSLKSSIKSADFASAIGLQKQIEITTKDLGALYADWPNHALNDAVEYTMAALQSCVVRGGKSLILPEGASYGDRASVIPIYGLRGEIKMWGVAPRFNANRLDIDVSTGECCFRKPEYGVENFIYDFVAAASNWNISALEKYELLIRPAELTFSIVEHKINGKSTGYFDVIYYTYEGKIIW